MVYYALFQVLKKLPGKVLGSVGIEEQTTLQYFLGCRTLTLQKWRVKCHGYRSRLWSSAQQIYMWKGVWKTPALLYNAVQNVVGIASVWRGECREGICKGRKYAEGLKGVHSEITVYQWRIRRGAQCPGSKNREQRLAWKGFKHMFVANCAIDVSAERSTSWYITKWCRLYGFCDIAISPMTKRKWLVLCTEFWLQVIHENDLTLNDLRWTLGPNRTIRLRPSRPFQGSFVNGPPWECSIGEGVCEDVLKHVALRKEAYTRQFLQRK